MKIGFIEKFTIRRLIRKNLVLYALIVISSFLLDVLLFDIFDLLFDLDVYKYLIIMATIAARILSSIYNYCLLSRLIFKKYSKKIAKKYFTLVIVNMLLSCIIVYLISRYVYDSYVIIIKMLVDSIIFVINYFIQKKLVFK